MRLLKISIIVIVGISLAIFGIFYTQEIEQNPQLSTKKDSPEDKELTVQKTWIELEPINCYGNLCNVGWLSSYYNSSNLQTEPYLGNLQGVNMARTTEFIMDYYKKQGIVVFDARYSSRTYPDEVMCESGECWLDYKLEILISDSDVKKMLDLGFKVSETPQQEQLLESEVPLITTEVIQSCSGSAQCISGTVTRVVDGDTVEVNGQSIRFALSSTPEIDNDKGVLAKAFVENLCPTGSQALVDEDDKQTQGSYGRIIGIVYCNGINLNEAVLDSGHGWISKNFCSKSEFASEDWAKKYGC